MRGLRCYRGLSRQETEASFSGVATLTNLKGHISKRGKKRAAPRNYFKPKIQSCDKQRQAQNHCPHERTNYAPIIRLIVTTPSKPRELWIHTFAYLRVILIYFLPQGCKLFFYKSETAFVPPKKSQSEEVKNPAPRKNKYILPGRDSHSVHLG